MNKLNWAKNIFKVMLTTILAASFITTFASGLIYDQRQVIERTAILGGSGTAETLMVGDLQTKNIINILLLGTDDGKQRFNEDARADSITLISLNFQEKTAKVISIERSVTVHIDEIDDDDWITHVFRYSGSEGVVSAVEDTFDVEIDKYVRVNFSVFKDVIDIIDGVEIELTSAEAQAVLDMGSQDRELEDGKNLLNGHDALLYSRLRAIDSNYERMNRQKNVLKAIVLRAKEIPKTDLLKLAVKILPQVETDFKSSEISGLILNNTDMLDANIEQSTIPNSSDIIGGDRTADGRILTRINIPAVNQKMHFLLYSELIEIDPEELAEYENYESKYTASQVINSDPHQDVDDEITLDDYEIEYIEEKDSPDETPPVLSQRPRSSNGTDVSWVDLPTREKTPTITDESTDRGQEGSSAANREPSGSVSAGETRSTTRSQQEQFKESTASSSGIAQESR